MTTSMPAALDSFSDPSPGDLLPGHAAKHDLTQDALYQVEKLLVGPLDYNVLGFGADRTGGTDSTSAITAANTAAHTTGGAVVFPTGLYRTTAPFQITSPLVSWVGAGSGASYLAPTNNGDCIRVQMSAFVADSHAGKVSGLTIDGTFAGVNACGIHYGDTMNGRLEDLHIVNFTGSSAVGVKMENTSATYTEGIVWDRMLISNCSTCVLFDVSGSDNSFGYHRMKKVRLTCNSGQVGIRLRNGALVYNGEINVSGNFGNGSTVMEIEGISGTGVTAMANCLYCFQAECATGTANGIQLTEYGAMTGQGVVDLSSGSIISTTAGSHPGTFDLTGWIKIPGTVIGQLRWTGDVSTTVGGAGGAAALPVTPAGYILVESNGLLLKVPAFLP